MIWSSGSASVALFGSVRMSTVLASLNLPGATDNENSAVGQAWVLGV